MEVYENYKKSDQPLTKVVGDSFKGLYYPYIINGKSKALYNDFNTILLAFVDIAKDISQDSELITHYSELFKKLYFSKILIRLKTEDSEEAWNLLWGVWTELFNNPPDQIREFDIKNYRLGLVFTCFFLYHSQVPEQFNSGKIFLSIPISVYTFDKILDFSENLFEKYNLSISIELIHYLYRQGAFSLCLFDGPQYIHQDRLGNILKIS